MTDNEIIKALGHCVNSDECHLCECPFGMAERGEFDSCLDVAMKHALSLINRQKAEIERLQNDAAIARKEAERFKSSYFVVGVRGGATHRLMEIIRLMEHDAIKEFAERLKSVVAIHNGDMWSKYEYIDNLVKEMVGDDK